MNKNLKSKNYLLDFKFYNKKKYITILSKNEEYILTKNFKEKNDKEAIKKLIEANINYIIKIAKNYTGYGIMIKDLIQEGVIGLIKAIKNFNPEKKIRLISFAILWIKSEIQEYIIKNLKIVKIATTKKQKKLLFNLKKIKKIGWLTEKEKTSISSLFNIKKKDIEKMEEKLDNKDNTIDIITNNSNIINKINKNTYNDPLINIEKKNWNKYINNKLKEALKKLDIRSKIILEKRWLQKKKTTLKYLAQKYEISQERIRQIEIKAIKKLKKLIKIEK